ncbi:hypothetical protein [Pleurocapsa sp. PCC 7319]|uniref:hypothetical protein n=1 Tax=Pleurocapsa sp. PCC 7319 TaxID=118161 RepID=UPI000476FF11|nr:hypothetical protein [Pleurocapsa sp. PCC 7319]
MPRINIHSLSMQISRMFEQGQSFFCAIKVQDWLRERNENPDDYEISFHEKPAPPGSGLIIMREIELRRKDGKPVEAWLQEDVNSYS